MVCSKGPSKHWAHNSIRAGSKGPAMPRRRPKLKATVLSRLAAVLGEHPPVKEVARDRYNYTFGPAPVSAFVSAFYDAVLLYALALNETVRDGGDPHDGKAITERMWNRTFNVASFPLSLRS
ncbi:hypothetical protein FOCC_FOCC017170 [Frankliniella occidentalis]|nr:hypothetical protein FOCC_FOCC017170 [Frankliniella occidentalis]